MCPGREMLGVLIQLGPLHEVIHHWQRTPSVCETRPRPVLIVHHLLCSLWPGVTHSLAHFTTCTITCFRSTAPLNLSWFSWSSAHFIWTPATFIKRAVFLHSNQDALRPHISDLKPQVLPVSCRVWEERNTGLISQLVTRHLLWFDSSSRAAIAGFMFKFDTVPLVWCNYEPAALQLEDSLVWQVSALLKYPWGKHWIPKSSRDVVLQSSQ